MACRGPSLRLHPRGEATIQEVAQEPLILYDRGSAYFIAISQACQQAGIVPRVEMDLDSIEATKLMVELGMGISFLLRSGVNQEIGNGTLTTIPVMGLDSIYLPTRVLLAGTALQSPGSISSETTPGYLRRRHRSSQESRSTILDRFCNKPGQGIPTSLIRIRDTFQ